MGGIASIYKNTVDKSIKQLGYDVKKTVDHATTRQQYHENFDEQNDSATKQAYVTTPVNLELINHYNKYKKTYITIIILLLLLVLAIILITSDNVNTMTDSGYQLTVTPGMQTEM